MNINTYQAEMLWLRFTSSKAINDAEMVAGQKLTTTESRCQFLMAWALGMANGDTGTMDKLLDMFCGQEAPEVSDMLNQMADLEATCMPPADQQDDNQSPRSDSYIKVADRQPVPGPRFPLEMYRDGECVKPKWWDTWPAAYRKRWLAEQVDQDIDASLWPQAKTILVFCKQVGLHPTKVYNRCGPEAYKNKGPRERVPDGYLIRKGTKVRVNPNCEQALHDWLAGLGFPTKPLTG